MSASDRTNQVLTEDRLPVRFPAFQAAALVIGIVLSLVLAYFVRDWERTINQAEFEFLAGTHASDITKVKGVSTLYSSNMNIVTLRYLNKGY